METFTMPLHEIQERFTKSELFMMAWRSQEQHYHLKKKMPKRDSENYEYEDVAGRRNAIGMRHRYSSTDIIPEGTPERFYAQDVIRDERGKVKASPGEINLSQVTGEEARKYMAALGIRFPVMGMERM